MIKKYYRILDTEISVECDSEEFIAEFNSDYGYFEVESPGRLQKLNFCLVLKKNNAFIQRDNEIFSLNGHPDKSKCAYQILLKQIFSNIRDFFLSHAGVVSKNGKALILAGSPGLGKTTAVSELLKNGFAFLSDDFCPVHKKTGLVHPFPRSLWKVAENRQNSVRKNKISVCADKLPVSDKPSEIKNIVCLESENQANGVYLLCIGFKSRENEIIRKLEKIDGVKTKHTGNEFSDRCISYPKGKGISENIRHILEKYKDNIWNVFREEPLNPDFSEEPVLTGISGYEAAFLLIKDLKNDIIFSQNSKPLNLLTDLSGLIQGVSCYRLNVGKLESVIKILLKLHEQD